VLAVAKTPAQTSSKTNDKTAVYLANASANESALIITVYIIFNFKPSIRKVSFLSTLLGIFFLQNN
jgi:hypothetical protein